MRIIAGVAGGIPILCPKNVTRPTSERVREAVFSILGVRISGARVLDLYAGSGALGLEALSRGAESASFVERSREACQVITANVAKARLKRATVVHSPVDNWIKRSAKPSSFDLIFADPPYLKHDADPDHARVLVQSQLLADALAPGGLLVIETQSNQQLPQASLFSRLDRRVYGSTSLHLLTHADN